MTKLHIRKHLLPWHDKRQQIVWGLRNPTFATTCPFHDWYFDYKIMADRCSHCGDQRVPRRYGEQEDNYKKNVGEQ